MRRCDPAAVLALPVHEKRRYREKKTHDKEGRGGDQPDDDIGVRTVRPVLGHEEGDDEEHDG